MRVELPHGEVRRAACGLARVPGLERKRDPKFRVRFKRPQRAHLSRTTRYIAKLCDCAEAVFKFMLGARSPTVPGLFRK